MESGSADRKGVSTTTTTEKETPSSSTPVAGPSPSLFYGKTILAPMVRVGGLGFRLLCAACGADVVFSEEVVAAKLATCRREVRHYPQVDTPVVEYVTYDAFRKAYKRGVVYSVLQRQSEAASPRTNRALEVLQLGVSEPATGARAAALCGDDVDGIDLNMGCPKTFSVRNGFGAALMGKPVLAGEIVKAVEAAVNDPARMAARGGRRVPVSIKTRLRSTTPADTVEMLRTMLTSAGHSHTAPVVHAITLHARLREQRSEQPPLYDTAAAVVQGCRGDELFRGVCFVLNGSIASRKDGERKWKEYGFDAAMLARAALLDPSRFARTEVGTATAVEGADPPPSEPPVEECSDDHFIEQMRQVLVYSARYRAPFNNFKYLLTRTVPEFETLKERMPTLQHYVTDYASAADFLCLPKSVKDDLVSCVHDLELCDGPPSTAATTAPAEVQEAEEANERPTKRPRVESTPTNE